MTVKLLFTGVELWIWTIYAAPSDPDILEKVFSNIATEMNNESCNNRIHIISGDWNKTVDSDLDRSLPNRQNNRKIFAPLINLGLFDTFRHLYPTSRKFSWTDGSTMTRIDHIWASDNMEGCILNFEFFDSTLITDSDHNILIADLDTSEIISNNWAHTQLVSSNNSDKRLIYHFADLTSDHWDAFQLAITEKSEQRDISLHIDTLFNFILTQLPSDSAANQDENEQHSNIQKMIDVTWSRLINIIKNSCIDTLPLLG